MKGIVTKVGRGEVTILLTSNTYLTLPRDVIGLCIGQKVQVTFDFTKNKHKLALLQTLESDEQIIEDIIEKEDEINLLEDLLEIDYLCVDILTQEILL